MASRRRRPTPGCNRSPNSATTTAPTARATARPATPARPWRPCCASAARWSIPTRRSRRCKTASAPTAASGRRIRPPRTCRRPTGSCARFTCSSAARGRRPAAGVHRLLPQRRRRLRRRQGQAVQRFRRLLRRHYHPLARREVSHGRPAYIALGSNLGDRRAPLDRALADLRAGRESPCCASPPSTRRPRSAVRRDRGPISTPRRSCAPTSPR